MPVFSNDLVNDPVKGSFDSPKVVTRGWRTSALDACALSFFTSVSLLKGDLGNRGVRHV